MFFYGLLVYFCLCFYPLGFVSRRCIFIMSWPLLLSFKLELCVSLLHTFSPNRERVPLFVCYLLKRPPDVSYNWQYLLSAE